ncbi:hypothetical protein E2C01_078440 [Portunus trituberculatus]|uniref:Uncharacterized protein n=1 Tax=Portunus trituberculatus TaxID=210409 RepID=A0A5B7IU56_PORTR|nr:hypothetical protein [Portunus trituberculatus]
MVWLPPWRCVSLLPRPRTASGMVTRTRPVFGRMSSRTRRTTSQ